MSINQIYDTEINNKNYTSNKNHLKQVNFKN